MANFKQAYEQFILPFEGGYANNPNDKGGETYAGISRKFNPNEFEIWGVIDAYKAQTKIPWNHKFIQLDPFVEDFYRKLWDKNRLTEIHSQGIAATLFDFMVNSGAATAIKELQKIVGVTPDGIIGPKTLSAINKSNEQATIKNLLDVRENFYAAIVNRDPSQAEFLKHWTTRLQTLGAAFLRDVDNLPIGTILIFLVIIIILTTL